MANEDYEIPTGVEYPKTAYTSFYMCRACGNHVLARGNRLHKEVGFRAIFCENIVNALVGTNVSHLPLMGYCEVDEVRVYCDRCHSRLGKFYAAVSQPNEILQAGRFLLFLKKLKYWNGRQVISALTRRPIPDDN